MSRVSRYWQLLEEIPGERRGVHVEDVTWGAPSVKKLDISQEIRDPNLYSRDEHFKFSPSQKIFVVSNLSAGGGENATGLGL